MSDAVRVLIVDDQALFRQGLHILLDAQPGIIVVGEAGNGEEALHQVEKNPPDVVLMDMQMPVMDGVTAIRHIKRDTPHIQVIALTTFDDDHTIFEALRAGATGYMLKDVSVQNLVDAIEAAARGESLLQPTIAIKIVQAFAHQEHSAPVQSSMAEPLTFRELDILRLVAEGMNNKEIATQLFITEGTVKNHVSNIIGKMGVRDRTQAAIKAKELRLI